MIFGIAEDDNAFDVISDEERDDVVEAMEEEYTGEEKLGKQNVGISSIEIRKRSMKKKQIKNEKSKLKESDVRVDAGHKTSRHSQLQSRKRSTVLSFDSKRSRIETRNCKVKSGNEINMMKSDVGPCSMKCKAHNGATKQDNSSEAVDVTNAGNQSKKCVELKRINPVALDGIVIAQGTFHQGDRRFGSNCGKQCVANSLASIMYSKNKDVKNWKCDDMDTILMTGNELYGFLQESSTMNNDYLLINELPSELDVFDTHYNMKYYESVSGTFDENACDLNEFNMVPLKSALETSSPEISCMLHKFPWKYICCNCSRWNILCF